MILSCFPVTGKTFFHFFYPFSFSFSLFFLFLGRWPVPSRAGLLSFSLPRRPISFSPPSPLPAQVGPFFFFLPLSRFSHRPGNPTRQPLLPPPAGFGRDSALRLGLGPARRGRPGLAQLPALPFSPLVFPATPNPSRFLLSLYPRTHAPLLCYVPPRRRRSPPPRPLCPSCCL